MKERHTASRQKNRAKPIPVTLVYPLTLFFGAAWSLFFYGLVEKIKDSIGVSTWEHSIFLTVLYGSTLAVAIVPLRILAPNAGNLIAHAVGTSIFAGALASLTPVGAPTAALVAATFVGLALVTRLILSGVSDWEAGSLIECILIAILTAATVVSVWMIVTAPAYAEGFVVLSCLLVGIFHLAVIPGSSLALEFVKRTRNRRRRTRFFRATAILAVASFVSLAALIYLIQSEGVPRSPLEQNTWPSAFSPLVAAAPGNRKAETPETRYTKEDIVALLAQRSSPPPPAHLATLFLLTGKRDWAEQFRELILEAAAEGRYTNAEGSVKFGQRHVMNWALYFTQLNDQIPDLFSDSEKATLQGWFTRILKKIFEPGWVDYLYALPFGELPYGPYLNQEVGAGAVAVLLPLIDPEDEGLQKQAQAFLDCCAVGWRGNFRNQDDSYAYQDVWMGSAFALHRYADNNQLSASPGLEPAVEWIKTQMPLHAYPMNYGLPGGTRMLDSLAIGAFVLRDPHSRWLLDRQLDHVVANERARIDSLVSSLWLWDDSIPSERYNPTDILIDGPTGYTFRPGLLEPDKLVFRRLDNSAEANEIYALVNLRNDGWHRYPATNSVIRLSRGQTQLIAEGIVTRIHNWLPKGRSHHRDKKIDRARINSLSVARTGLDAWIGAITSVYSGWRQDAPSFADVTIWGRDGDLSVAQTTSLGPDELEHTRWYIFDGNRHFVVFDQVHDRTLRDKSIFWHLVNAESIGENIWQINGPESAINRVFVVASDGVSVTSTPGDERDRPAYPEAETNLRITAASRDKTFALLTVVAFDSPEDPGTRPAISTANQGSLQILRLDDHTRILLSDGGIWEIDGLRSNARAARIVDTPAGARLHAVVQ